METTPKQYAEELVKKFMPFVDIDVSISVALTMRSQVNNAKKCALISIQESINHCNEIWFSFCEDSNIEDVKWFLQSVKQEIEAM